MDDRHRFLRDLSLYDFLNEAGWSQSNAISHGKLNYSYKPSP